MHCIAFRVRIRVLRFSLVFLVTFELPRSLEEVSRWSVIIPTRGNLIKSQAQRKVPFLFRYTKILESWNVSCRGVYFFFFFYFVPHISNLLNVTVLFSTAVASLRASLYVRVTYSCDSCSLVFITRFVYLEFVNAGKSTIIAIFRWKLNVPGSFFFFSDD